MRRTVQGIVLREINYKEADKILTVLTREEGKLTLKARGCRRKNSRLLASSQLLVYSELAITQRGEFITLTEGDPLTQFRRLGEDIDKLALASYFAEVTEKTVQEGEVCPDILSLLLNCLYALDTLDKPLEQVKAVFQLRLLTLTGLAPLLDTCVVCGNPQPAEPRLHLLQGVLHCAACRTQVGDGVSMPLSPAALIRQTAADFLNSGLEHEVDLDLRLPKAPLPRIEADAFLLRRALNNLLLNAARHAPPGSVICLGVTNSVGAAAPCGPPSPTCVLWVENQTGPAQAQPSDQDGGAPHGTGRKLVSQIAQAHGGRAVFSDGTRFRGEIWLPVGDKKQALRVWRA